MADQALFEKKGKKLPQRLKHPLTTYKTVWLYFYGKETGENNRKLLDFYLSADSPLQSFFELRQQQWAIVRSR